MTMTARYTVVDGEMIAEKRSGSRKLYAPDPLGSTAALLDNTQTKTDTFTYWPYGEEKSRTGTTPTSFRYVGTEGYYRDSTTRTYVRARYLDTAKGMWLTKDPVGFRGGSWNLYRYVKSRPMSGNDPLGMQFVEAPIPIDEPMPVPIEEPMPTPIEEPMPTPIEEPAPTPNPGIPRNCARQVKPRWGTIILQPQPTIRERRRQRDRNKYCWEFCNNNNNDLIRQLNEFLSNNRVSPVCRQAMARRLGDGPFGCRNTCYEKCRQRPKHSRMVTTWPPMEACKSVQDLFNMECGA